MVAPLKRAQHMHVYIEELGCLEFCAVCIHSPISHATRRYEHETDMVRAMLAL